MATKLVVFQSKKALKIRDDGNAHVQINLTTNEDGTTSAQLFFTCVLDPSSYRIVPQTGLNPDNSAHFDLKPGEFGYDHDKDIHAGTFTGDTFMVQAVPGPSATFPLGMSVLLGGPKIDYGSIILI